MNEQIFIVDDEEQILRSCRRILSDEEYICTTFTSPVDALEQAMIVKPAVIIADQRMPYMEGTEFLEKIKQKLPATVRILMTGYADIESVIDAINRGHIYRFIKKPWNNGMLKRDVRHAIEYFQMNERLRLFSSDTDIGRSIEQERLQGVLEMAGAVCHEFSQPLQVITGFCELLSEMPEICNEPEEFNKYLSMIFKSSNRISNLLKKIMKIRRYETRLYMDDFHIVDINKASAMETVPN